jgi:hypothetical protein
MYTLAAFNDGTCGLATDVKVTNEATHSDPQQFNKRKASGNL